MSKPIAIYAGYLVRYPLGGHLFTELNTIVGLQRLGYEVVVVEESGGAWAPCYDPQRNEMTADPSYGIATLHRILKPYGLERNWCYVDPSGYHGLSSADLRDACRNAAFLFNRAGVTWLEEFRDCPTRIYFDADPGFSQFNMARAPRSSCSGYASPHDFQFHFSIGRRMGKPDCPIPTHGLNWRPARQPVLLDLASVRITPSASRFTTIMSWSAYGSATHEGVTYGQKNVELLKFLDLPKRVGRIFEIALGGPDAPYDKLRAAGWQITDALDVTMSVESYLDYIRRSRGEFSVAKEGYVKTRCGWFSDRTAAYLASGKPAIVQDTGFSESLPCGDGLFGFTTADHVVAAVEAIASDYPRHCRAARRIAEDHFESTKVLGAMLRECGVPVPAPG